MEVYERRTNDKRTSNINFLLGFSLLLSLSLALCVRNAGSDNSSRVDGTNEQKFCVHSCTQSHFDGVIRLQVLSQSSAKTANDKVGKGAK